MNILFVCAQNVGRSQMAAELFNKFAKEDHADSAGTAVQEPGQSLGERAQNSEGAKDVLITLGEEGIEAQHNIRTQLTNEMVAQYDRVIVMAERDTWPPYLKESDKVTYWEIDDPRFKGLDATRKTKNEIKQKVVKLIAEYGHAS